MTSLVQYERARSALAEATRIDEIIPIIDEVEQVRRLGRQINDQQLVADATAFQMRAERRLGFVIKEAKKAGHFKDGRPKNKNGSVYEEPFPPATLQDVGVSKKLSARAQKRSTIAEQAFEAMVTATRERIAAATAVPVNGAQSIAPGRKEPSVSLDYSPTPPWATRALLERVFPAMGLSTARLQTVLEPACGEGHMAEVLCEYFRHVDARDIHGYGYSDKIGDFLTDGYETDADWIITNPPFKDKAEQFALKAIELAKFGVAIFARLQWLETIGRYERLFRDNPPAQLAFFAERVNLCMGRWEPNGGTATAYMWIVWVKGRDPLPPFWIPPGCKESLTRVDDAERFTAHPVTKIDHPKDSDGDPLLHDDETGEVIEQPKIEAEPIPQFLRRRETEQQPTQ
jgi:hypothetical protein